MPPPPTPPYPPPPQKLNKQHLNLLKTLYHNPTPIKTIPQQCKLSPTTIYPYLNTLNNQQNKHK
ncbi:helix-turn-helix domain-containing protein [Staphylococcus epidermidis]|uniref:helix-turn-helix domain-containing protein n=1 Tax=Staphylococcus epidermidis TaxID=1282 RepID=UPI0037DA1F16